jgi:GH15 family glucan-1,4-alpha-glucosidase
MDLRLGIIGNCQYNALVSPSGNIEWMCWPRLDSSFVFGGLLDQEKGGRFSIATYDRDGDGTGDDGDGAQSYYENTNVLVTRFETKQGGAFEVIDFAPRFMQYERFYKPKMLVRIVRPVTGMPLIQVRCEPRYDYGRTALVPEVRSNHIHFGGAEQPIRLLTNASLNMIVEGRPFVLAKTHYFVLTWGFSVETDLRDLCESYLEKTIAYWQRWVKHCHLPPTHQKPIIRSALCLKLHQFEDTGAIVAATTTSIPEAKDTTRNWDYRFCWLRDAYFTLQALRRLGQFEEMEGFVSYLRNIAELATDRLQPVYGVTGEVTLTEHILGWLSGYKGNKPVRIGNQAYEHLQHDIYGEMIMSISPLFLDARFALDPAALPKDLLEKLLKSIELFVESSDAGLWEYRGIAQVHTFSVLMHWAGAKHAAAIARRWGYDELVPRADELQQRSYNFMRDRCWNPEIEAYAQAAGSRELDAALLLMVPLGFLRRDDPRAIPHVQAIRRRLGTDNDLLHRYVHSDDFGATDNAFTVCSFWLTEACALLGEKALAERVFHTLLNCSNHLGLYSEDLNPRTLEQWGNFPQTYSHVGLINAAFALNDPWE